MQSSSWVWPNSRSGSSGSDSEQSSQVCGVYRDRPAPQPLLYSALFTLLSVGFGVQETPGTKASDNAIAVAEARARDFEPKHSQCGAAMGSQQTALATQRLSVMCDTIPRADQPGCPS